MFIKNSTFENTNSSKGSIQIENSLKAKIRIEKSKFINLSSETDGGVY